MPSDQHCRLDETISGFLQYGVDTKCKPFLPKDVIWTLQKSWSKPSQHLGCVMWAVHPIVFGPLSKLMIIWYHHCNEWPMVDDQSTNLHFEHSSYIPVSFLVLPPVSINWPQLSSIEHVPHYFRWSIVSTNSNYSVIPHLIPIGSTNSAMANPSSADRSGHLRLWAPVVSPQPAQHSGATSTRRWIDQPVAMVSWLMIAVNGVTIWLIMVENGW